MEQWRGKVAIVTGASVGIGANVSIALADAGMTVIGMARRLDKVEELQAQITGTGKIVGYKIDLTVEEEIKNAFKWIEDHYKGADVLINNAALLVSDFVTETPSETLRKIFDLNVVSATIVVQEAITNMRKRGTKGHIIALNSILGHRIPDVPKPVFGIYPASKHAITALAHLIKSEMAYHKAPIKFTSVSPGMVNTALIDSFSSNFKDYMPKLEAEDVTQAILYALGTPDRVQVEEIILQAMHHVA